MNRAEYWKYLQRGSSTFTRYPSIHSSRSHNPLFSNLIFQSLSLSSLPWKPAYHPGTPRRCSAESCRGGCALALQWGITQPHRRRVAYTCSLIFVLLWKKWGSWSLWSLDCLGVLIQHKSELPDLTLLPAAPEAIPMTLQALWLSSGSGNWIPVKTNHSKKTKVSFLLHQLLTALNAAAQGRQRCQQLRMMPAASYLLLLTTGDCAIKGLETPLPPFLLLKKTKKNQMENKGKDNTLCWSIVISRIL